MGTGGRRTYSAYLTGFVNGRAVRLGSIWISSWVDREALTGFSILEWPQ